MQPGSNRFQPAPGNYQAPPQMGYAPLQQVGQYGAPPGADGINIPHGGGIGTLPPPAQQPVSQRFSVPVTAPPLSTGGVLAPQAPSITELRRLYIANLQGATQSQIREISERCGQLVDVMWRDTYAFTEFATYEDTLRALEVYQARGYKVEYAKIKTKNSMLMDLQLQPKLYVRGISKQATDKDLEALFRPYGGVTDVYVKDGYAFIEFNNPECAYNAVCNLHGVQFQGQRLVVEAAKPKARESLVTNPRLYVGRVNPSLIEKQDLFKAFEVYGKIIDFNYQRDFAFVEYDNVDSASNAMREMNGALVNNVKITVEESKSKSNPHNNNNNNNSGFSGQRRPPPANRPNLQQQYAAPPLRPEAYYGGRSEGYHQRHRSRSRSNDKDSGRHRRGHHQTRFSDSHNQF